jgi:hypothetical protein
MTDTVRRRPRRMKTRARTGPMRLHIISFRFAVEGTFGRMTTVLVQGRMDQCAAMKQAPAEARTRGPEPWLTNINTVPPFHATPALDAICRQHTAFSTFLALLTQPAGYRPSIRLDLTGQDGAVLARAYDRVQAKWGDPRRAFVSGDVPRAVRCRDKVGHATA